VVAIGVRRGNGVKAPVLTEENTDLVLGAVYAGLGFPSFLDVYHPTTSSPSSVQMSTASLASGR
jgi:hypothetical protein